MTKSSTGTHLFFVCKKYALLLSLRACTQQSKAGKHEFVPPVLKDEEQLKGILWKKLNRENMTKHWNRLATLQQNLSLFHTEGKISRTAFWIGQPY